MILPQQGTIAYNGFTFPTYARSEIRSRFIYDSAGRTVIYTVYTLTVSFTLTGNVSVAAGSARVLLSKPAGALTYASGGFGAFQINVNPQNYQDVIWGPKPQELSFKPCGGGGNAADLVWQVEVAIPECGGAIVRGGFKALEFNFTMAYDVDRSGYTKRTCSGYLQIPMTRTSVGNRTLPDSVDVYRERIDPPHLPGFRRIPGTFTTNEAKTRLNFSITDEQMPPNIPPPGIVEASANHSYHTVPGKCFTSWIGTIEGDYELARNGVATAADASQAFFALVADRLSNINGGSFNLGGSPTSGKATLWLIAFEAREPNIYGKSHCAFSLSYSVLPLNLESILTAGGLFRPTPVKGAYSLDNGWSGWDQSMRSVLNSRGHAQLIFRPGDDKIVDACQAPTITSDLTGGPRPATGMMQQLMNIIPQPTPDTSWIDYKNYIWVETDSGTVASKVLPAAPPAPTPPSGFNPAPSGTTPSHWAAVDRNLARFNAQKMGQLAGGGGANGFTTGAIGPTQTSPGDTRTQQRVSPTIHVIMSGWAHRLGFAIPCPDLTTVNGVGVTAANRPGKEYFVTGVTGSAGYPVLTAKWQMRYAVDNPPPGWVPVLPNPLLGA